MTQHDADTLQGFSGILWGARVFRVRLNIEHRFEEDYSAEDLDELSLDFHEPVSVPEKILKHRRVGSLWISASNSGVRLERAGKILVGSSDSVAKQLEPFRNLVGVRLLTVTVRPPGGDTTFLFESDLALNCFPAKSREGDSWVVVTEDSNQFKLGPGIRVTYESCLR